MAIALQSRVSEVLQVDMHPAAQLGRGIMIDHATGVVIGETAIVGDNVSLLHHTTLGGSGTGTGKRHPTIGLVLPMVLPNTYSILLDEDVLPPKAGHEPRLPGLARS